MDLSLDTVRAAYVDKNHPLASEPPAGPALENEQDQRQRQEDKAQPSCPPRSHAFVEGELHDQHDDGDCDQHQLRGREPSVSSAAPVLGTG